MTRQNTTNPDTHKWALMPQQEAAVDLLAVGTSVTDAAASVGVARQTVSEWLHHHHGFEAALNRRRLELWSAMIDLLRALVSKALAVLQREIDEGATPLVAAIHVLKASALYGRAYSIGSRDADELETDECERVANQQKRRLFAF